MKEIVHFLMIIYFIDYNQFYSYTIGMAHKSKKSKRSKTFKKPIAKCQCYVDGTKKPCPNRALRDSVFCKKHQDCPVPPLTGVEPIYAPEKWNRDLSLRKSHNCYSYAMGVIDPSLIKKCEEKNDDTDECRSHFHQPGSVHGERDALNAKERRNCKALDRLIKADNPGITKSSFYGKCPAKTSKIYMTVDRGEDFHFYEQNPPELLAKGVKQIVETLPLFSDKGGSNPAKKVDAIGKPIFNPELASRDFRWKGSDINYEDSCGFYCVPRDGSVQLASSSQGGRRRSRRS
jgi:hypothetical protein